jgi:hypothetical protein
VTDPSVRPRPTPDGSARSGDQPHDGPRAITGTSGAARRGQVTRVEIAPSQVVAAAGTAVVTAAKMGRLLGRTGWRLARQLPGARTVERETQRLQNAALGGARRWLRIPPPGGSPATRPASPAERRAVDLIGITEPGDEPLRTAMAELLERSVEATRTDSHEYLYGSIISQLVPDEARILAALADGTRFAAADVVQKQRRGRARVLVSNASAVGRQAGLVSPDSTPTYLTRLHGFGLVEFGPEDQSLSTQYDILATEPSVRAVNGVTARRGSATRTERKTVQMSAFGRQFWSAADPSGPTA